MRCDVLTALNLLMPRHNGKSHTWTIQGWCASFNSRMLPAHEDKKIHALMKDFDKATPFKPSITWLPVVDNDVWFIQRTLRYCTMDYMRKRAFKWQAWRPGRLPIYLKWRGKYIVWNGTHRTILCMLVNKPLRVKLIDMDAFVVWCKAHPNKSMWGVRKVVTFAPKGKKRGRK